jgi:flavin reductase
MADSATFIHAMGAAVAGVTVVTTNHDGRPIGRTVSAMCSVSADPALLLVSIRTASPLLAAIAARAEFAVNVLSAGQAAIADAFAGRGERRYTFGRRDWRSLAADTVPLLHGAAARFTCRVATTHEAGTHTLVLGAVTRAERGSATPLAYTHRGYIAALALQRIAA